MKAGSEASRLAYNQITMTATGNALSQIAAGRRSIQMTGAIDGHPKRFAFALSQVLANPVARRDLRELLDSYEPAPAPKDTSE
jgi:hypothetical protein